MFKRYFRCFRKGIRAGERFLLRRSVLHPSDALIKTGVCSPLRHFEFFPTLHKA